MKIALILPYFGKLDHLFPLWLQSCRYNHDIDWLIFTNDRQQFNYPNNTKVYYIEFDELKNKIQSLYNFPIALSTPYRLCNFRPAYGNIFEEYLKGYDAWGFCDNDMIFGDLKEFFPQELSTKFKIGKFGHLSIFPNDQDCKTAYKVGDAYKIAFSIPQPLFFDEETFPRILSLKGYREYKLKIADFIPRLKRLNILNEPKRKWLNNRHIFVWHKGHLYRYYVDKKNTIQKEEYAYIHFLKRPMQVNKNLNFNEPILIVPNKIYNFDLNKITPQFIFSQNKNGIFWAYWKNSLKWHNLIERIKNRVYQNKINRNLIHKMNDMVAQNRYL